MSEVKNIPNGWVETTLGEVCSKIGSGSTPTGGNEAYKKSGISLVRSQNIHDFNFSYSGLAFIDDEQAKKLSSVTLESKDVLLNITGDSVARSCMLPDEVLPARVNQHVAILRANTVKIDNYYLKYLILNPICKSHLLMIASSGATRNALTKTMLEKLDIILPSLHEQKSIASILTAFDDKIELLQAQNKTLEETAQTIFAEWFGKYQIEDELPDGWRVGKIREIVKDIIDNRGKTPPIIESTLGGIPLIEVNSITGNDRNININVVRKFVDIDTYENWFRKGHPIKGDILISTVGSIGQLGQVYDEKISIAQNIVALRSDISGNFLYELLKFNQKEIISIDISSVQPSIKVPHLLNIEIIIPDEKTTQKFDTAINSLTNKLFENYKQIQTLNKTRDELLPRLMSGEVRVNEFKV